MLNVFTGYQHNSSKLARKLLLGLGLLLVLSGCSSTDKVKTTEKKGYSDQQLAQMYASEMDIRTEDIYLSNNGSKKKVGTKTTFLKLFKSGETTITNRSYRGYFYGRSLNINKRQSYVLILGHTDNSGKADLNLKVSDKRAKSISNELLTFKVNNKHVYYKGLGEYQPVASNKTAAGKALNRRVELLEFYNFDDLQAYYDHHYATLLTAKYYERKKQNQQQQKKKNQTASNKRKTPPKKLPTKNYINFGGEPYDINKVDIVDALGPIKQSRWALFSKAFANEPPPPTCLDDMPKDKIKEKTLSTSDYLPGMSHKAWWAKMGKNAVLINPVAIAKKDATPVAIPTVSIYKNYKTNKKALAKYPSAVKVYNAEDNILFRLFIEDKKSSLRCIDLVLPKYATSKEYSALKGKLYYNATRGIRMVDFLPKKP